MQSLQMRCPVAATMGLSIVTIARPPMLKPSAFTVLSSETFSSSGQPASVTPNTVFWNVPDFLSLRPREQLSFPWLWHQMQ